MTWNKGDQVVINLGESCVIGEYRGLNLGIRTVDGKPAAVVQVDGITGYYDQSSLRRIEGEMCDGVQGTICPSPATWLTSTLEIAG